MKPKKQVIIGTPQSEFMWDLMHKYGCAQPAWGLAPELANDLYGPDWSRAGFDILNEPRQPVAEGWLQ